MMVIARLGVSVGGVVALSNAIENGEIGGIELDFERAHVLLQVRDRERRTHLGGLLADQGRVHGELALALERGGLHVGLADLHQHFICSTKAEQARARVLDVENDVCDYCRYDREAEDVNYFISE